MKKQKIEGKKKHVIILGAGASITSGYPDSKKLRLLMTSEDSVRAELDKLVGISDEVTRKDIERDLGPMFRGPAEPINHLFRNGGFATVDEFSKLAGQQFPKEIQALKARLRFALGLHNPEDKFQDSDYYPFIQKLFRDGIYPLRSDVSILTFNYDPYLPFLLNRALEVRNKAAGKENEIRQATCLTSGFRNRDLKSLRSGKGMCLLHLHGMIVWPTRSDSEHQVTFDDLFNLKFKHRITKLHSGTPPPIVFPWEIIDRKGKFYPKQKFCLQESCDDSGRRSGGYEGPHDLHDLFVAIWTRARTEILAATKISFVGLSMHDFLEPAFRFLFKGKKINARIVFASKELEKFRNVDEAYSNPRSPVCKARRLLKRIWPGASEINSDGMVNVHRRETFAEFIEYEMD